jgi:hypothetical protein
MWYITSYKVVLDMAKHIIVEDGENDKSLKNILFKSFQSCNINFLIGAGCSNYAIPYDNTIEQKFSQLPKNGKLDEADKEKYIFLQGVIDINEELYKKPISDKTKKTLNDYKYFIKAINHILFERKSNIIHKQANIFSTNYDLFIEQSAADLGNIYLNDGFHRNTSLKKEYIFSNKEFFNYTCHNGSFFDYKVDIPSINLIKLHGSLSWRVVLAAKEADKIIFSVDFKKLSDEEKNDIEKVKEFNRQASIVLPDTIKYQDTVLNHNYYDLIRIFSHELEKENTILLICGFGFNDSHIEEVIKRALGNPTLNIFIFAYSKEDEAKFADKFEKFNNVTIISHKDKSLDFDMATRLMNFSL